MSAGRTDRTAGSGRIAARRPTWAVCRPSTLGKRKRMVDCPEAFFEKWRALPPGRGQDRWRTPHGPRQWICHRQRLPDGWLLVQKSCFEIAVAGAALIRPTLLASEAPSGQVPRPSFILYGTNLAMVRIWRTESNESANIYLIEMTRI